MSSICFLSNSSPLIAASLLTVPVQFPAPTGFGGIGFLSCAHADAGAKANTAKKASRARKRACMKLPQVARFERA
jgi:hypothetical protein